MCLTIRMLACICLCCMACERNDILTSSAAIADTGSVAQLTHETSMCAVPSQACAEPSTYVTRAVKQLDDYSAALGLQCTRFSYGTNRVVGTLHTNYLSTCNVADFADFLQDLASVRARQNIIGTAEYALVKLLAAQRLHAALMDVTQHQQLYDMIIPMMSLACVAGDFDYIVSLEESILNPDIMTDSNSTLSRAAGLAAVQMLEYLSRAPQDVCTETLPHFGRKVKRYLDSPMVQKQDTSHLVPLYYSLCLAETWYAPHRAHRRMKAMQADFMAAFPEYAVRIQAYNKGLMAGKHADELDQFVATEEDRYIRCHTP